MEPLSRRICLVLFIVVALVLLAGCGGGGDDSVRDKDQDDGIVGDQVETAAYCDDWATQRFSEFIYENNVWNKLDITDYEQCILKQGIGDEAQYGWRWRWPSGVVGREYEVKSFPNVFYGHHPWYEQSTTAAIPIQVKDIAEFDVTYEVDMTATGRNNLAFQMWVTSTEVPEPDARTRS